MTNAEDLRGLLEGLSQVHLVASIVTSILSSLGVSALIRLFFEHSQQNRMAKLESELQKEVSDRQISFNRNFERIEACISALYKDLAGLQVSGGVQSRIAELGGDAPFSDGELMELINEYQKNLLETRSHTFDADLYLSEQLIAKIEEYTQLHTKALASVLYFAKNRVDQSLEGDAFQREQMKQLKLEIMEQSPIVLSELKTEFRTLLGMTKPGHS